MHHVMLYLENSARCFPDRTAVIDEKGSCSYTLLRKKSLDVASYLADFSVHHEPVIVFMEKGIEALYAFFGISYAKNTYSLLNPDFPKARLQQISQVLEAKHVITDQLHVAKAKEVFVDCKVHLIEKIPEASNDAVEKILKNLNHHVDTSPLYIHFTSGSTGIPKGVVVSHQSVIDFIDVFTQTFDLTECERIGNQAPFDFDVSVKDIYSCLKLGATLVIIPKHLFSNPTGLMDYLCEHHVTTLIWAVSALSLICIFHGLDYRIPSTVTKVMFSGEVMPVKHLKRWQQALPDAMFVNLYGPTEVTCNCTYHIIQKERDYTNGIPIGRSFLNEEVFLLDESNQAITVSNQTGEIVVKGRCLALGYYRMPDETNKRFIQNPLCSMYPEKVYLTGDLGYYNEDGELVYAGRKDFQIKYRGHRIELEEIERQVTTIEEVLTCCCIFDPNKKKLYGFYVGPIASLTILDILKAKLPVYMIPTKMIQIDQMPLSKNGKIDRQMLKKEVGL